MSPDAADAAVAALTDPERRARVVLSLVGEPGDIRLTGLVAELGPVDVLAALVEQGRHRALREALGERLRAADAEAVVARAARRGIRFVTPRDEEWPGALDDLAHAPYLHERGGVPVGLWVRGPLRLDEVASGAVAVVGSRSATGYGAEVAGEVGATVAGTGRAVVSGAAFGIDMAAHRGALAVDGPTVAVLACGADRSYPAAHHRLLEHIAEVGLVVSEAAPGAAPLRIRFLARNRVIAALATGCVVVEAAARSGALNTANWAAGLSRVVMGVPGPVTSAPSVGVHQLIRARDALLVTGGEDVLEAVGAAGVHLGSRPQGEERPRDRLEAEHRQVLEAVPRLQGATVRSIARVAGLAPRGVAAALVALHTAGFVERAGEHWRQCPEVGPEVGPEEGPEVNPDVDG
ncbi:DNA-processing protein DprA [Marmoricola sp. RAF53]|uniref:DNA-processing protein DprA n=1 Tax=Marmoricola sp. RAF53 TaxID=3233059 RepID=UPI003F9B073F